MFKYKLTEEAKELKEKGICDCTPVRGTTLSAGLDLKACLANSIDIMPLETVKIFTGVHLHIGVGTIEYHNGLKATMAGLYLPRSSNKGLQLENTVGLLDDDYQGESFLKLYNKTDEPITINPGDRIAQLVIFQAFITDWQLVDTFTEVTERGEGGDGSTGKQ